MTVSRFATRCSLALVGAALAGAAAAHPGHGVPAGHAHGSIEMLATVAVVIIGVWLARGKR